MRVVPGWLLSTRVSIALTWVVAVLSLVTGIANIGTMTVTGPFAELLPGAVHRTAGFTGAFTGFVMLATAYGLRRGLRVAWTATVILLPLTVIQGVAQSSPLSIPLIVVSVLAFPHVAWNRSAFEQELSLTTTQWAAIAALVGAQAYGTVGTYVLREEFTGIFTPMDAFYYSMVTGTTVGYGDAHPETQVARLFATSLVVLGTGSFAFAAGAVLGPAVQSRLVSALGKMTDAQLDMLEDHVVVLGYGDLTEPLVNELDGEETFVVVTPDAERAMSLSDRDIHVLQDDPTDEDVLRRAGLDEARAVVAATNDDGHDALAVLTARELAPDLRIVAAVTEHENVRKLRRAGADAVLSPASIGGRLLVRSALGDEDAEALADRLFESDDG